MIPANTPVGTICRMLESSGSLPAGTEIEIKENLIKEFNKLSSMKK